MDLVLGLGVFVMALKLSLDWLRLPLLWGMGAAVLVTAFFYPAIAVALSASPVITPGLIVLAAVAGWIVGRGGFLGGGWPPRQW